MSGSALPSSPSRGRYQLQVSRSITERLPGTSSRHGHTHSSHHHHDHHLTRHIPSTLHRRDRSRDGRGGGAVATPPSAATPAQVVPRGSLEAARHNEGATPGTLSPDLSRRGSVLVPAGGEAAGAAVVGGAAPLSREEELRRERERAEANTAGLRKSLLDLAAFSTATNRRLDETYYIVLQKLTALQNTILALKDLAQASAATNAGFIAESHGVLAEAQAQLDAFGDFTAQQARVEALQGRVHGGRERIAALGERVDAVRRRVERWERADREWQERTRRRLKMVWGVAMALGCLLAVLYWGARAYAPEAEGGVARGIREEVVTAVVGVGSARAGDGGGGNDSTPGLDFNSRDGRSGTAGDEALRALDEL